MYSRLQHDVGHGVPSCYFHKTVDEVDDARRGVVVRVTATRSVERGGRPGGGAPRRWVASRSICSFFDVAVAVENVPIFLLFITSRLCMSWRHLFSFFFSVFFLTVWSAIFRLGSVL